MSHDGDTDRRIVARRDMALVVSISLAAALLCVRYDFSEALTQWTRLHERLQLDEMPAVLLVFAACLIWFSWRRYAEARRQLDLRRAIERELAEALAENQRLAQQYADLHEFERKALARDLHDELGQYLNVIKLDAVAVRESARTPTAPNKALLLEASRAIVENVDRVYAVVGNLIRQLRPVGFDELGVAAALEHCVNDWRARLPGTAVDLSIEAELGSLDETRALALFRLVQEALTNVGRHAHATRVSVRIGSSQAPPPETLDVTILDNGRGADMTQACAGLGLIGMRERVVAFGGVLTLDSRPGEGFKIAATLPVSGASSAAGAARAARA
jgi:two-component system sensor histidine kinase UhpB